MRGAFGKPQGTVARVRIGQPIMSVRTSDRHRAAVVEALRRAKFKFPGRQKVRHVNFCFESETSSKPYYVCQLMLVFYSLKLEVAVE
jgi:ribosomal protein L16/L10AE